MQYLPEVKYICMYSSNNMCSMFQLLSSQTTTFEVDINHRKSTPPCQKYLLFYQHFFADSLIRSRKQNSIVKFWGVENSFLFLWRICLKFVFGIVLSSPRNRLLFVSFFILFLYGFKVLLKYDDVLLQDELIYIWWPTNKSFNERK